jgi:hypothetical protein
MGLNQAAKLSLLDGLPKYRSKKLGLGVLMFNLETITTKDHYKDDYLD